MGNCLIYSVKESKFLILFFIFLFSGIDLDEKRFDNVIGTANSFIHSEIVFCI